MNDNDWQTTFRVLETENQRLRALLAEGSPDRRDSDPPVERVCTEPGGCDSCPDPDYCRDLRLNNGVTAVSTDENVDTFELVRPAEFATDYEWACSVTEDKWILEERLDEAIDALRTTWANVNAWLEFEKTIVSERQKP